MLSNGRQQRPSYSFRPKAEGNNRFPEKEGNYSPSARYLYGGASQPPQHQPPHSQQGNRREQHKGSQFSMERLAKQNDVIIRLLKEIRDRLPPPPSSRRNRPQHDHNNSKQPEQTPAVSVTETPVSQETVASPETAEVAQEQPPVTPTDAGSDSNPSA